MEAPVFASKLGNGKWVGIRYILERCPICGGEGTMMFTGAGIWGCTQCRKGGKSLDSLRDYAKTDPMLVSVIPSIVDPVSPDQALIVSEYVSPFKGQTIGSGFGILDAAIGGLTESALTIITGKRGEGKSTFLGQVALNAIENRHHVCFYSGELSAGRFQEWIFSQAAGSRNMSPYPDQFGTTRWAVRNEAEKKIREWLGKKLLMYDNTKTKASERHTILRCFREVRSYYGCDLFVVDNLMTAKADTDVDQNALRAQANFAGEMMDFAREASVHVIIVAHQKKGENADVNDGVSGLSEITNLASNVILVKRVDEYDRNKHNCDSLVIVSKNRDYGDCGTFEFNFDKPSKRFVPLYGSTISKYGWEMIT